MKTAQEMAKIAEENRNEIEALKETVKDNPSGKLIISAYEIIIKAVNNGKSSANLIKLTVGIVDFYRGKGYTIKDSTNLYEGKERLDEAGNFTISWEKSELGSETCY